MPLTPVEIRHVQLRRAFPRGYRRSDVDRLLNEIADSFEAVWRERSELAERVLALEAEVARHVELENLLRSTLVSAERAAQDMKERARREADVIVAEAGAEGRSIIRDAIAEKERLLAETQRVRTIMRAALEVLSEIFGGTSTSRLYRSLVIEQKLATSAGAFYRGSSLDLTTFRIYATPRPGVSLDQLEAAVGVELERVKEEPITEQEVERATRRLVAEATYAAMILDR